MKILVHSSKIHGVGYAGASLFRAIILSVLFIFLYFRVLWNLVTYWSTHAEYSHAFLIPVISAYLLWRRREHCRSCLKERSPLGGMLFVVGLSILLLGVAGEEEFLQQISLPVTLFGLVYFLNGKNLIRVCLFPIAYLFLMIPIPYTLYKTIALKLRLLDAKIAATWASFLGVPVFQEDDLLYLPDTILEVADGCSGVLSILALLSLGIFYIHHLKMQGWGKLLLLSMLIPVSILANAIRIVIIVIIVHFSGRWILNTTFHQLNGTFNFILGFIMIVFAGFLINRLSLNFKRAT